MIIALDLETTGLNKREDKIIEVALVKIDEKTFKIIEKYSTFVNPEIDIPEIISNITNITDKDVKDAPKIEEIRDEIKDFIGNNPILGHNVMFDKDFLVNNDINIENNVSLDTFLLANFLTLDGKSLNLEYLCSFLNIKLTGAHRALNDTIATVKVFKKLVGIIKKLPKHKKEILKFIISTSDESSWKFIKDKYLEKNIKKIKKDIFIKNILKVIKKYSKEENKIEDFKLEEKDFKKIISKIGGLELRQNQIKMSSLVNNALEKSKKILVEAPTGIGKTFAYLLPSIIFAKNMGQQVYVSTSTKVLQDQIFYKDLDFLSKNLKIPFSYSKLKGKANYLGVLAFLDFFFLEELHNKNKISFFLKIIFWLFKTKHGELDELNYYGDEFGYLKQVNANNPYIFSKENQFESYEFILKARRKARKSDIVIINNNILFQDIVLEGSILGNVKNLILDEAHNLEDVVTNSVKKSFSIMDLERSFLNTNRVLKKYKQEIIDINYKQERLSFDINTIFNLLETYVLSKTNPDSKYKRILIGEDFLNNNDALDGLLKVVKIKIDEFSNIFENLSEDIYSAIGKEILFLEDMLGILEKTLSRQDKSKYIAIASFIENKGVFLEYTLLNPGDFLKKKLWNKIDSLVLTSATLKTGENFDYIKQIMSLEDFTFHELDTDFNYKKQALLFIPNDIGSIKNNLDKVLEFLGDFLKIVRGRTLVLFTAFFAIKKCYTKLNFSLKKENINLFAQSIGGGKYKQMNFFKENPKDSVLIGTDTFWEGVDIPGEDLKYLVIHKIPFMVPSDPIFIARSKLFKDSFKDYSIPKSILKLKQGFGRLIRSKKDTGIVIFLDDRIHSTAWGRSFLKAFPKDINIKKSDTGSFLTILKEGKNNKK